MTFIPKSSFWRTTLLVWLVILLSQIAILWFAVSYLYLPGIKQNAQLVALEVDTIRFLVNSERKVEFLQRLQQQHSIDITYDAASLPPEYEGLFSEIFVSPMRKRLGPGAQVRLGFDPDPSIWVSTPQLGTLWVRFPLENFGRYEAMAFLAWVIGTPVLAFLVASFFVRQLNRPLKNLESAARRIGRGEPVKDRLLPNATREINAVNQAFLQMSENLQRVDRERALLLAGISHDLRTPLTRMRLTAELLGESEFTEGMVRDIEDMNAILDQFILFVRDGSDEKTEVGDLNEVIGEVVSQFESENRAVRTDLQPLPGISLKRLSLKRMFANLIGNAIRHGGGDVEVHSGMEDGEICVRVADRGAGLTETEMHDLFEPFARGDQSRTTTGSGLGLAIVKRIVDMHHGRVRLQNREGGGLEAIVTFPVTGDLVPPESLMAHLR
ncbi:HAMP domain-containing protein [Ketobacter sp. MCCC 1A13808]|uniref:ATP-binding protein n=1 Tax=Ketobacter sp. MCCC 1A13808 TaxID=2602738 RepID=UPI000F1B188C|nr:ATP-binding protein [Ketobacter sp. MCCC 1A13808]MVF14103.1 HAMP domain-containing protein [Ketobacter sp. MCCC 1A13808]RLP55128.1 MAG: HAMP domain-containing protein [Ketobacter sp.]